MARRPHFSPPVRSIGGRQGLVAPSGIDPTGAGGPTPRQAGGPRWRAASHGLYVPADVEQTPYQRTLEAGLLLPAHGAITGWAALGWFGAKWCEGITSGGELLPVPVVAPEHGIRSQPSIALSEEQLPLADFFEYDGLRFTSHVRSVCFEVRRAPTLAAAVSWIDRAAAADLVSLDEVSDYLATRLTAWTGVDKVRAALPYARENCWSPTETDMRLLWEVTLGLSGILCNQPIFDASGRHLGTPDLLDRRAGVAGEYDSELHWDKRAHDLRREGDFRRAGLQYVAMVAQDRSDPSDFLQRTRDARRLGLATGGPRRWTIEPPRWWTPTTTVAQRRALTADQRARLLRWQAA